MLRVRSAHFDLWNLRVAEAALSGLSEKRLQSAILPHSGLPVCSIPTSAGPRESPVTAGLGLLYVGVVGAWGVSVAGGLSSFAAGVACEACPLAASLLTRSTLELGRSDRVRSAITVRFNSLTNPAAQLSALTVCEQWPARIL
jgi:hypothetical protein